MSKDKKKKAGKKKDKLKALAQNPVVADVVAAALVATAAALKDSKRARALASDAGDELTKLSKSSSNAGSAMWELALQIGRQSLEALVADPKKDRGKEPKSMKVPAAASGNAKDDVPARRPKPRSKKPQD